jgi:beta-galactosidase
VEEQYVRYSRPQAYGNHTDTRWTSLTDSRDGVLVAGAKGDTVDVSVTQYDGLDRAEYDFQRPLVRNKGWTTLHVEDAETGMGETPNGVQAPYKIDPNQPRSYSVTLRPLSSAEASTGAPAVTGEPACDPTTVLQPQGEAKQGEPLMVQVKVTGECAIPVRNTAVTLTVPDGWKVEPGSVSLGDVAAQETKTASFTVTPALTAGFGSYDLVAKTTSDQGVVGASARVECRWRLVSGGLVICRSWRLRRMGGVRLSEIPAMVRTSVVMVVRCALGGRLMRRGSGRTRIR